MSVWNDIRKKSLGQETRTEDVDDRIVPLEKSIINRLENIQVLYQEVTNLYHSCLAFGDRYLGDNPFTYIPVLDDNETENALKSNDYEIMTTFEIKAANLEWCLMNEKGKLVSELYRLQTEADEEIQAWEKEIEQRNKREEEQEEKEKKAKKKNLLEKLYITLGITAVTSIFFCISSVKSGDPWWTGLVCGALSFIITSIAIFTSE